MASAAVDTLEPAPARGPFYYMVGMWATDTAPMMHWCRITVTYDLGIRADVLSTVPDAGPGSLRRLLLDVLLPIIVVVQVVGHLMDVFVAGVVFDFCSDQYRDLPGAGGAGRGAPVDTKSSPGCGPFPAGGASARSEGTGAGTTPAAMFFSGVCFIIYRMGGVDATARRALLLYYFCRRVRYVYRGIHRHRNISKTMPAAARPVFGGAKKVMKKSAKKAKAAVPKKVMKKSKGKAKKSKGKAKKSKGKAKK